MGICMSEKSLNILFTSVGRRSYLVKYFREALKGRGKIYAANSSEISTGLEVADERVITPLIYSEEYIPFLLEYCKNNRIDSIIPLFDVDLPVLSKNKCLFDSIGVRILVADESVIDVCNDKWKTFCFLRNSGIETIPTFLNLNIVKECLKKKIIEYPLVIKPRWGMGSVAIYKADNDEELSVLYKKVKKEVFDSYLKYESRVNPGESVIIQPLIKGQEYGIDSICDLSGNYVTSVIRKKIEMRAGETDCAEIVESEDILDVVKKLALLTKHCAIMDIDMIVSNNIVYVLEMNARFGGGYPFGHVAGVNLPLAIIRWLNNESVEPSILTPKIGTIAQKSIEMQILHTDLVDRYKYNSNFIKYSKFEEFMGEEIGHFIKNEIDPYLSISLKNKMQISIDEYARKIVKNANGYVAIKNEKIIGIVAAYIDNRVESKRAFLTIFGVDHRERNNGIGSNLLKKIIEDVPNGCCLFTTVDEANEDAWRVYQKAGFHECYVQNGRKHIETNLKY